MSGSKLSDATPKPEAQAIPPAADQPLGLTVHGLPDAQAVLAAHTQRTTSGRWRMLLVMAICAAPVLASYFTFYVLRPEGRRNYGELIHEQPSLPDLKAMDRDGHSLSLSSLRGQWLLISVGGGQCKPTCEQQLYWQRQLRESLGKEKDRLDWVWLIDDESPVPERLQQALNQAVVLRLAPEGIQNWLYAAHGHDVHEHLYLVDPMGHWMLRFPAGMDLEGASKAKKDLLRLLNASAAWDTAGRPAAAP
jgi:hypothetical protein